MNDPRLFFQLVVTVPWDSNKIYYDHNDRIHEIIPDLIKITIDCINQHVPNIEQLPDSIFIIKNGVVIGMKNNAHDEQSITNIFKLFLSSDYYFEIVEHTIDFGL